MKVVKLLLLMVAGSDSEYLPDNDSLYRKLITLLNNKTI